MAKRENPPAPVRVGYPDAGPEVKVGGRGVTARSDWAGDQKRGVATLEVTEPARKRPRVKVRKALPAAAKLKRKR